MGLQRRFSGHHRRQAIYLKWWLLCLHYFNECFCCESSCWQEADSDPLKQEGFQATCDGVGLLALRVDRELS